MLLSNITKQRYIDLLDLFKPFSCYILCGILGLGGRPENYVVHVYEFQGLSLDTRANFKFAVTI